MKRILEISKQEFKYLHYSKMIYILAAIILILMSLNIWANVKNLNQDYGTFLKHKVMYENSGLNIEKELQKPLSTQKSILSNDSTVINIDNPIRHDYEQIVVDLGILNPNYFLHNALELLALFMGPITFGIFGACFINYDYKYKVVKVKTANNSWVMHIMVKQLIIIASVFLTTVSALIIVRGILGIIHNYLISNIDTVFFIAQPLEPKSSIFIKILAVVLGGSLFGFIGSTLVLISKNVIIPTISIILYNILVPNLGPYDIKNMFLVIGHKVFEFYGNVFNPGESTNVDFISAVIVVVCLIVFFFSTNLFIAKNQSKYV